MERLRNMDYALMISAIVLTGVGIVMIYSASSILALENQNDGYLYLKKQALFALIGIALMIGVMNIPLRYYPKAVYPLLILSVLFLAALFRSGLGLGKGVATRWLQLPGLSFQPSEFAKFALVLYLAYSLSKKQEKIKSFSIGFFPHLAVISIVLVLILKEPDLGTAITLGAISWTMMFAGGVRLRYLMGTLLAVAPLAYYFISNSEYHLRRIKAFLSPWSYYRQDGFQIIQSYIAFGSGGLFGVGLGQGKQKLFYLPEPHTDFIFSVIGEELGLAGVVIVVSLLMVFLMAGIRIALKARGPFSTLLALGMTSIIGIQSIVNLSVVLGLLPTTGLPLPFISYGGSSLVVCFICTGVLLRISSSSYEGEWL